MKMLAFIRGKFRMPRLRIAIKIPSFPRGYSGFSVLRWYSGLSVLREKTAWFAVCVFVGAVVAGFLGGLAGSYYAIEGGLFRGPQGLLNLQGVSSSGLETSYVPQTTQEEKIIRAVQNVSPAVVSTVITKDVPILEQYFVNPFGEGS